MLHLHKHSNPYKNWISGIVLSVFLLLGTGDQAWPENGVKVVGSGDTWPGFTRVVTESMAPFAERLETDDDNFKEYGVTGFTGIRISRLMELAGKDVDQGRNQGLTIIGTDQYVGYLPKEKLEQGLLAWEMNGKPITGLTGGPLKLIFPKNAGIHSSCYTWYVAAMVAGNGQGAQLSVTQGENTRQYSRADLLAHTVPLDRAMFSIAQGCRNEFDSPPPAKEIRAVPISWFMSGPREAQGDGSGFVQLIPLAGPVVTLPPELLDYPVFIIVSCDNRGLHPALGGPFSVVFPVETHPELRDMVPETGALFFLEKIIIK